MSIQSYNRHVYMEMYHRVMRGTVFILGIRYKSRLVSIIMYREVYYISSDTVMIQLGYYNSRYASTTLPCHTLSNTSSRPITTVLLLLSSMVVYIDYTFVGFNINWHYYPW